ncbi:hypothetical protein M0811_00364 [Anaeramoeba ignava]|uniref:Uncharacterized protein n=1 Tax=Anaeramoeba ignava TaxID=1746090 RepID=A0A9Q0LR65_ANAIG|nr:hypothetical protein M0811_00364 [Anaeramoeba ignava]
MNQQTPKRSKLRKESNSNSNTNILDIHNDSSLKLIPSLKEKLISPKIESNSLPFQSKMNYFLQKDASKQLNINIPSTKKKKKIVEMKNSILYYKARKKWGKNSLMIPRNLTPKSKLFGMISQLGVPKILPNN